MFSAFQLFRINPDWSAPSLSQVEAAMDKQVFRGLGATQKQSHGWVPPRGPNEKIIESVDNQWILRLKTEKKAVPGPALRKEVERLAAVIEKETGRKPGRKERKELKDQAELNLLPNAFSREAFVNVWINRKDNYIVVGAGSLGACDNVITLLVDLFSNVKAPIALTAAQTDKSPQSCMAQWLLTKEAPGGFTVDRDLELRAADESKAAVRYSRHSLDNDEVVAHIKQGMMPTQLAMTYDDRVSFVLCDNLTVKKIALLEVALKDMGDDADLKDFDTQVAIYTGEMMHLIPDVIDMLGGYLASA